MARKIKSYSLYAANMQELINFIVCFTFVCLKWSKERTKTFIIIKKLFSYKINCIYLLRSTFISPIPSRLFIINRTLLQKEINTL